VSYRGIAVALPARPEAVERTPRVSPCPLGASFAGAGGASGFVLGVAVGAAGDVEAASRTGGAIEAASDGEA
jgi:hypothetical protein